MGHTLLLMVIQVTTMNILIYPSISNNLGDLPVNVCSLTTGRRRQYHSIRPGQHQADKKILVNFNLHALMCHLTISRIAIDCQFPQLPVIKRDLEDFATNKF